MPRLHRDEHSPQSDKRSAIAGPWQVVQENWIIEDKSYPKDHEGTKNMEIARNNEHQHVGGVKISQPIL